MGAGGESFKRKEERRGSVEIIILHNVLGDVCRSRREGKLEKMSIRTSSIYIAPATVASPLAISIENRLIVDLWKYCENRDFTRA